MDYLDAMQTYVRGERGIGLAMVALGLAFVAAGFWVWRTQEGGFVWGLLVPMLIAGIGAAIGGGFLAVKTDAQVSQLESLYAHGPADLLAVEVPRMTKVNANWPRLKVAWASIMVVALGLLLFVRKDWVTGTALGLVVLMAMVLVIDVFA